MTEFDGYDVESFDGHVIFKGNLSSDEAIKFIEFYKNQGYTQVLPDYGSASIFLSKEPVEYELSRYFELKKNHAELQKRMVELECNLQRARENTSVELKKTCERLESNMKYFKEEKMKLSAENTKLKQKQSLLEASLLRIKEKFIKKLSSKKN